MSKALSIQPVELLRTSVATIFYKHLAPPFHKNQVLAGTGIESEASAADVR
ncbi:MAG: hypothetical protein ACKVVP_20485 [Chloroflexota bacterium]